MKESEIQKQITGWLAVNSVWCLRMNVGSMSGSHAGKKWFVRFGEAGQADLLAFPYGCHPVWIEIKQEKGKQSGLQKSFEAKVREEGHYYFLVRSLDELVEQFNLNIVNEITGGKW